MIIVNQYGNYRPGEDDIKDEDIVFMYICHDNYIPTRQELMEDDL